MALKSLQQIQKQSSDSSHMLSFFFEFFVPTFKSQFRVTMTAAGTGARKWTF
jgi:hypothetical protein